MILITMKGKPFYASVIDFGECAIAFFFFFLVSEILTRWKTCLMVCSAFTAYLVKWFFIYRID